MGKRKNQKHGHLDGHDFSKEEDYYDNLDDSEEPDDSNDDSNDDSDEECHDGKKESLSKKNYSRSSGLEDILFKMPCVKTPLMGSPKQVQTTLDEMALEIQRDPDSRRSEELYNAIFLYMHGYLINVALKQFPYIKGMQTSDIFQQSLIALRFKAIPNFKTGKGMSFLNFAKMCIRRHLITLLNASKNCQKHQSINRAVSIDRPIDSESENTFLSILSDDSEAADQISENKEALQVTKDTLRSTLSDFEAMVLDEYLSGGSYREIAQAISIKTNRRCVPKAVDNALLRIRKKALILKENDNESLLPLFM